MTAIPALGGQVLGLLPLCENEDEHSDERPFADVRMTWPDGRFKTVYACQLCAIQSMETYVFDDTEDGAQHPVMIEPVYPQDGTS